MQRPLKRAAVLCALSLACVHPEPNSVSRARDLLAQERPPTGDLTFACVPADANVFVDGIERGHCQDFTGTRGLSLESGIHQIEIRKNGYWPYTTYFEPNEARGRIAVTLRPEAAR